MVTFSMGITLLNATESSVDNPIPSIQGLSQESVSHSQNDEDKRREWWRKITHRPLKIYDRASATIGWDGITGPSFGLGWTVWAAQGRSGFMSTGAEGLFTEGVIGYRNRRINVGYSINHRGLGIFTAGIQLKASYLHQFTRHKGHHGDYWGVSGDITFLNLGIHGGAYNWWDDDPLYLLGTHIRW